MPGVSNGGVSNGGVSNDGVSNDGVSNDGASLLRGLGITYAFQTLVQ